ncbi:hypothetical protein NQ314_013575 [Rhamnusium bicolor]|uniref:Poly [ADP-ribose] polymerase n=1 Tax=Rhamnusium bicolor TaxID=1586634 RepID=A0AAV8X5S3_9CUCU|nr:hypothetical protein NQ314_013575 [Rhamnusium bicolor]
MNQIFKKHKGSSYKNASSVNKTIYGKQESMRNKVSSLSELEYAFSNLSITKRNIQAAKPIKFNPAIIKDFLKTTGYGFWCDKFSNSSYLHSFIYPLETHTQEFCNIKSLFTKKNKSCKVKRIEKIHNPYLLMQYKLKEKQVRRRYGNTREETVFHGTKKNNAGSICNFNFDWRLKGRHKFGHGVSFASTSSYATHYGDKSRNKIMFIVNVLISNQCLGNKKTIIPPLCYDTTTNEKEQVLVKYEDNTFYPAYIIHYEDVKPKWKRNRATKKTKMVV